MKVMKFGGTSVGSVKSMLSLKSIVSREAKESPLIVVVSALGGITDKLLLTSRMALDGNKAYRDEFDAIVKRHHDMVDTLVTDPKKRIELFASIDALLEQLKSIYYGLYLVRDLSEKTQDTIVSYGEKLSSRIVAAIIKGAVLADSQEFIITERKGGKNMLDSELTSRLIGEAFAELPRITIAPGFISRDRDTGDTTNLGRGGSDYTAAIIAAALNADSLEIWTDVDGFMTADPRIIPSAYTIDRLSYLEATELCNFGAKVIYPPTIYPVCVKNIPIRVKNTFNPSAPGTVITAKPDAADHKPIKGMSSINDTAILTVAGLSMVGVIGVNRRIFTALASEGISVFMVCQASSENSTSIGVRESEADKAARVLNEEFAKEIGTGAMYPMQVERGLATLAIVGENMRHTPGVAGKLFGTLGRAGISVIACSQGAAETNISFIIKRESLKKALGAIHESFFLSDYKVLNIFVCGVGQVGSKLLDQLRAQQEVLKETRRLVLKVVGIANSHKAVFDTDGIDLSNYRQLLDDAPETNIDEVIDKIAEMNLFNSVFVDCTASERVASAYHKLLDHNVNIVAANKIAASSDYSNYVRLKTTALARGVKFCFETNVGAGLPIIGTINDLVNSGDKVLKIEAVLSGTLNYILNALSAEVKLDQAVRMAQEEGYCEPDPRVDLYGIDVVRKLVILAREAGYKIEKGDIENKQLLPAEWKEAPIDEFWKSLPEADEMFDNLRIEGEKEDKKWRFVASIDNGKAEVGLRAVGKEHPFYDLEGSNNIVLITTSRYLQYPMQIKGYGAGASVTAAGVFANIMSIANI